MKRSKVNKLILAATNFAVEKCHRHLPQWAYWNPKTWQDMYKKNPKWVTELVKRGLGWDYFAGGHLVLITLSNGILGPDGRPIDQGWATKLLFSTGGSCPGHAHIDKRENIILEAGERFIVTNHGFLPPAEIKGLREKIPDQAKRATHLSEILQGTTGIMLIDNKEFFIPYGERREIDRPGTRAQFPPGFFHEFICLPALIPIVSCESRPLVGNMLYENSDVNDDGDEEHKGDNEFIIPMERFAGYEADEEPLIPLCNEIATLLGITT